MVNVFHREKDLMGYFIVHISTNEYWLCLPDILPKFGKLYTAIGMICFTKILLNRQLCIAEGFHDEMQPSQTDLNAV